MRSKKSSYPCTTIFISSWNTAGALLKPKGMTLNWNNPLWHVKAVFSLLSSSSFTCQYPLLRSSVVKYFAFPSILKVSSISGRGCETGRTILFKDRKSTHIRSDPSFFATTTRGNAQADLDLSITPASNISFIALSITTLRVRGALYGLCLIGGWSFVIIRIFTVSVWPNWQSFFAKRVGFCLTSCKTLSRNSSGTRVSSKSSSVFSFASTCSTDETSLFFPLLRLAYHPTSFEPVMSIGFIDYKDR